MPTCGRRSPATSIPLRRLGDRHRAGDERRAQRHRRLAVPVAHRAHLHRPAAARLERRAVAWTPDVQRAAYEALGDLQGAVIAIEPSTGRVLAMVTSPSYDTNLLGLARRRRGQHTRYRELVSGPRRTPLFNRAIAGEPEPAGLDVQARRGLGGPRVGRTGHPQSTPEPGFVRSCPSRTASCSERQRRLRAVRRDDGHDRRRARA